MLMIKKKGQRSEIIQTILQCLQLGVKVHIDQLNEKKREFLPLHEVALFNLSVRMITFN